MTLIMAAGVADCTDIERSGFESAAGLPNFFWVSFLNCIRCIFNCAVLLCIYFSVLQFQCMKYEIHIFIISFLFLLFSSLERGNKCESQRLEVTLFLKNVLHSCLVDHLNIFYFFMDGTTIIDGK